MKTGLAICAFILAAVAGLYMLELREPVDHATDASAADKLSRMDLPADLPVLFAPGETASGDAGFDVFLAVCEAVAAADADVEEDVRVQHADRVCRAMLDALAAGPFDEGFADRLVPPFDLYSDALRQLFRVTMQAVSHRIGRLIGDGAFEEADQLARAHFELGRRVFTQNTRLRARQHGFGLMHTGLGQARQVAHEQAQLQSAEAEDVEDTDAVDVGSVEDRLLELEAWEQAVTAIDTAWRSKLGWMSSARPNVADLIRVAEHDEDRSFRVYATHQLGYARFECGEPGNQRMIALAIERASASDDPLIRQAARFAQRMSREQFYADPP